MIFPVAAPRPVSGCRVRGHGPGLWETPLGHQSDTHLGVQGSIGSHRYAKKDRKRKSQGEIVMNCLSIFWGLLCLSICLLLLLLKKKNTYLYFFNDPPRIEIGWGQDPQKTPTDSLFNQPSVIWKMGELDDLK
jgi:hypothetical protein